MQYAMSNLIEVAFSRCGKKKPNDDDVAIAVAVVVAVAAVVVVVVFIVVDGDVVALAESHAFYFCPIYLFAKFNFNISADNNIFAFQ